MLAIEVNFLTERFVATAHHDRRAAEWPPHPARLFSALVAAWADDDSPSPDERRALEWLEAQDPPSIAATEAVTRKVLTNFVPVNDTAVIGTSWYDRKASEVGRLMDEIDAASEDSSPKSVKLAERLDGKLAKARDVSDQVSNPGKTNPDEAMKLLPDHRGKQAREFPSVTPDEPRVTYIWAAPANSRDGRGPWTACWAGSRGWGTHRRWCPAGSRPIRPTRPASPARWARRFAPFAGASWPPWSGSTSGTRRSSRDRCRSPRFATAKWSPMPPKMSCGQTPPDILIVFEFLRSSRRFPATRAVQIAATLRDAIFHHAENPIPEGLSGHAGGRLAGAAPPRGVPSPPLRRVGPRRRPDHGSCRFRAGLAGRAVPAGGASKAVGTWESEANAAEPGPSAHHGPIRGCGHETPDRVRAHPRNPADQDVGPVIAPLGVGHAGGAPHQPGPAEHRHGRGPGQSLGQGRAGSGGFLPPCRPARAHRRHCFPWTPS